MARALRVFAPDETGQPGYGLETVPGMAGPEPAPADTLAMEKPGAGRSGAAPASAALSDHLMLGHRIDRRSGIMRGTRIGTARDASRMHRSVGLAHIGGMCGIGLRWRGGMCQRLDLLHHLRMSRKAGLIQRMRMLLISRLRMKRRGRSDKRRWSSVLISRVKRCRRRCRSPSRNGCGFRQS